MKGRQNKADSQKFPILIVDDEEHTRLALARLLEKENFLTYCASSGEEALEVLKKNQVDIVVSDLKLPKMNGIELLKTVKKKTPNTSIILITGYGSIQTAVMAMKEGAYDYIVKPLDFDVLKKVIFKALEKQHLIKENIYLRELLYGRYNFSNIIGKSLSMQKVFNIIEKVADNDLCTVLIQGESGTGKELVAKAIHYNSTRRNGKFVAINCGSIPHDLLESELFGHVKGSFTGAVADKVGKFEYAEGGTIFLDEIGNMSPDLQIKLLRVLQEKEIERVGSTKTKKINVRVISASNVNLKNAIKRENFREDLYYRLNVVQINIPSLKERKEDIPLLVKYFLKKYSDKTKNKKKVMIDDVAHRLLESYPFPGNVRELENIIERAIILCEGNNITKEDLPEHVQNQVILPKISPLQFKKNMESGIDLNKEMIKYEEELIKNALKLYKGTKSKAAKFLNINRTTLVEKLKRMNINYN
jgi:DNA-binding NtrC family response regulator